MTATRYKFLLVVCQQTNVENATAAIAVTKLGVEVNQIKSIISKEFKGLVKHSLMCI